MDETLYSLGHGVGAVVQLENLGSEILNESLKYMTLSSTVVKPISKA